MLIRPSRVGDLGWAFSRQAVLYQREHGYLPVFEVYVAAGLAPFLERFDARRDRLWIAELHGAPVGAVAVQHDPTRRGWAQLRWYFVEAQARGRGVGSRLLSTAVRFARRAGYRGIYLWTVDDLVAARRQYERAGFALAFQDTRPCPWAPWGHEQRWELAFPAPPGAARAVRAGRAEADGPAPSKMTPYTSRGGRRKTSIKEDARRETSWSGARNAAATSFLSAMPKAGSSVPCAATRALSGRFHPGQSVPLPQLQVRAGGRAADL